MFTITEHLFSIQERDRRRKIPCYLNTLQSIGKIDMKNKINSKAQAYLIDKIENRTGHERRMG